MGTDRGTRMAFHIPDLFLFLLNRPLKDSESWCCVCSSGATPGTGHKRFKDTARWPFLFLTLTGGFLCSQRSRPLPLREGRAEAAERCPEAGLLPSCGSGRKSSLRIFPIPWKTRYQLWWGAAGVRPPPPPRSVTNSKCFPRRELSPGEESDCERCNRSVIHLQTAVGGETAKVIKGIKTKNPW